MYTESPNRLLRRVVGVVDALTAPHGVDRYVELVAPAWSSTEVRARIVSVARTTPATVTMTLRPNANWAGFVAGQYVQLTVEIDGVRQTRCYSMANASSDSATIELTVKAHPDGLVSNYLVQHADAGMVVGLSTAQGEFVLPAVRPERLLLVSGGSGITPVMSMLRTLCAEGHTGQVTFLHYAPTAHDMTYREELATIAAANDNVRLVRVFTDQPGTGDADGFLTNQQLAAVEPAWAQAQVYVCGPTPLMDAARGLYVAAGRPDQMHTEAFTLPQFVAEAGTVGGALRFSGAGRDVANDGRPILEQAETAGLAPEFGCRMGICHTCVRPLRCGTVRDLVSGELVTGDGQDIRICVSTPVGDADVDL